ncbi:PAS domain S-box protein [Amycolatopsis rhizosphaerae]|uniref:histidine kinase n=1 Tax=Amycolatopsis rhizosphaerae TaxID=2053003 RepID=A0A558CAZ2_9PSEU|nr:PAS domain-containing sensor histidine kinase [Amycolatopsis rhizosphaerae]TVT45949.1 PAS domain S-box protein [Amycolatopsis rhizosphaerae]
MQVDPRAPELVTEDFVAMLNASRMCVLVHDAATKNILWANPAACEMLEWSVSELRPLKAPDMSSSARQYDRVLGRAWLQDAVDKGATSIKWHYRSRSGRVIPTEAIAIRVELAQGPAVMVQFRDIEREQEIEQELRMATSYMDALAHRTSTIALMLDRAGMLRFATDTALEILGADSAGPLGPLERYGALRLAGRPSSWQEVFDRAAPVTTVQLALSRAQEPVWLEGSLERLQETSGEALLMILHDVSGRVQEEVRRERELQQENYLARYHAMGDMAMAIAHELGQPLAAAGNFLGGASRHAGTPAATGEAAGTAARHLVFGIDSARRQIDRASAIVAALRAFVGHLEHVRQVVDLGDVLTECLYFVRLRAEAAGVDVVVHEHPGPVPVRCERVLTGQVVLNLCFNAIDEMAACAPDRRVMVLTIGAEGGEGVLTVDDLGRGVRRDPFAQPFTSKEHGSGIGLALSQRIITRQHGRIWAERRDGGGSRFGFTLPLAREDAAPRFG